MWIWWVMGGLAVLLGAAALHDRRHEQRFSRRLSPGLSRADRRKAKRLHRSELVARRRVFAGYDRLGDDGPIGGFDGGHFGGFDGCGGGDGGGC
jgi:hypothetical protein